MTQRQLAELSTISVRAIRDLELDRTRTPRIQTIRMLADALRLSKARRAELEAALGPLSGEPLIDVLTAPPTPLGPIIGRAREVTALTALAESSGHRLVKVVGIHGVGKTRLIEEVASKLYRSGRMAVICLDGGGGTILDRLGIPLACEPTADNVAAVVANNDLLLTLDQHDLGDEDEATLRLLLRRCPGLRVLFESRAAAHPADDAVFTVFPLPVLDRHPDRADSTSKAGPAVEFLRSRCPQPPAWAADDAEVAAALIGICQILDGIPAALTAVATWLEIYEPAQLLDKMTSSPTVLTSVLNTIPAGPQDSFISGLRSVLAAMPASANEALCRLAEAESWTVEQAADLLGSPVDRLLGTLHALRVLGLVRRVEPAETGSSQFAVLNLLRHVLMVSAEPGSVPPNAGYTHGGWLQWERHKCTVAASTGG